MKQTRRSVLGAIGIAATVGIGTTQVIGQDTPSIKIGINAEDEYVTLINTGDSEADLSNYRIDLEYTDQTTQDRSLEDNTVIPAGDSLRVGTGSETVGDVDQNLGYKKAMLHNTEPDVVALLTPNGDVVATSDDSLEGTTTTTEEDTSDETTSEETSSTEEETTTENNSDESTADEPTTTESDNEESDSGSSNGNDSSENSSDDSQSENDSDSDDTEETSSDDTESSGSDESSSEDSEDDC